MEVEITVDRDGYTKRLQVAIGDEVGGFRLAGPEYIGASKNLLTIKIDKHKADEIRRYLDRVTE